MPVEEEVYDFLVNEAGEVLLVLNSKDSEPKNPSFVYNVEESSATLYRNSSEEILLASIPEEVKEDLMDVPEILVCEMTEDGDFGYTYKAKADLA